MKKILGLAVLATMPMACGTTPTSPEITGGAAATSADASFAASARGTAIPSGCTTAPDWASIAGITLDVVRVEKTSVTVRAELTVIADATGPTPCFNPVFSLSPGVRTGGTLTSGRDRQETTLTGPAGKYTVTAFVETDQRKGLSASIEVELEPTGRR